LATISDIFTTLRSKQLFIRNKQKKTWNLRMENWRCLQA